MAASAKERMSTKARIVFALVSGMCAAFMCAFLGDLYLGHPMADDWYISMSFLAGGCLACALIAMVPYGD